MVRRLVHESAYAGFLGRARSRLLGNEGAEALPRWDPSTSCPRWLLNTTRGGALEMVGSRIGLNVRDLVVPNSVDLGRLFEPFEGHASNL
jgi:hypothetical protein